MPACGHQLIDAGEGGRATASGQRRSRGSWPAGWKRRVGMTGQHGSGCWTPAATMAKRSFCVLAGAVDVDHEGGEGGDHGAGAGCPPAGARTGKTPSVGHDRSRWQSDGDGRVGGADGAAGRASSRRFTTGDGDVDAPADVGGEEVHGSGVTLVREVSGVPGGPGRRRGRLVESRHRGAQASVDTATDTPKVRARRRCSRPRCGAPRSKVGWVGVTQGVW